ncbi:MAG: MFS transporter, partial [Spirochaetales bacterium]|nr:MFS transporter [Spirochaetales bacterium]
TPLIDAGSLKALEDKDGHVDHYGRIRLMGSVGWIICCLITGRWLDYSGRLVDTLIIYAFFYLVLAFISAGGFATEVKKVDLSWHYLLEDRLLRVLFIIAFIRMFGFGMAFLFTGVYLADLNLSYTQMGLAFGLAALLEIPFFFMGNRLLKRWSGKALIMGEFVIQTIRFSLFFFLPHVQSATFYIAVQMLAGIGVSLHLTGIIPLLNRIAPPHLKASYQNLYTVSAALASILNGLAASLIVNALGSRVLMGICALTMIVAFAYTALRLDLRGVPRTPAAAGEKIGD